jgi:chromosomal replication initiator protein DnaA
MSSEKYSPRLVERVLECLNALDVLEFLDFHPELLRRAGSHLEFACPICARAGEEPSILLVSDESREFRCKHGTCTRQARGDIIELAARSWGWPYDKALERLAVEFDIPLVEENSPEDIARRLREVEELIDLALVDDDNRERYLREGRAQLDMILGVIPDHAEAAGLAVRFYSELGSQADLYPALERLAGLREAAGEVDAAASLLRQHALAPGCPPSLRLRLGALLERGGDSHGAIDTYMIAASLDEQEGAFDEAIEAYRRVERLGSNGYRVGTAIAALLVATGHRAEGAAGLLAEAEKRIAAGDTEAAIDSLRELTDLVPEDDAATLRLLELQLARGLHDTELPPMLGLVDSMLARGAWDSALHAIGRLQEVEPSHPGLIERAIKARRALGEFEVVERLQYELIEISRADGQLSRARAIAEEILAQFPEDARALELCAGIGAQQSDAECCVRCYTALLNLRQREGDRGECLRLAALMTEAVPGNGDLRMRRGRLLLEADQRAEALAQLEVAANLFRKQGHAEKLTEAVQFALSMTPENPQFLLLYGEALDLQGKWGEAYLERIRACESLIRDENWAEAERQLDFILQLDDRRTRALELHALVLDRQGRHKESREVRGNLLSVLLDVEEYGKCREVLESMLATDPDDLGPLEQLVDVNIALADEEGQISSRGRLAAFHRSRGRLDSASAQVEAILALRPDSTEGLSELVEILTLQGERERASEAGQRLAALYREAGDLEGEFRVLEARVRREPFDFAARERFLVVIAETREPAELLAAFDDYAAAATSADQGTRLLDFGREMLLRDLDNLGLHRRMISLYEAAGDTDQQVAQLQTLVTICERLGSGSELAAALGDLATLLPDDVTLRTRHARALAAIGRHAEAAEGFLDVAARHLAADSMEEAEEACREAVAAAPQSHDPRRLLVTISLRRNQPDEAVAHLRELSRIQADAGEHEQALATLDEALGHDADSMAVRRAIVDLCTHPAFDKPERALEDLAHIAEFYAAEGNEQASIDARRECVDLRPDSVELRRHLVRQYIVFGRNAAAALELVEIADLARHEMEYDDALAVLAEALEIDPDNVRARSSRAELFEEMGETRQALAEWRAIAPLIRDGRLSSSDQVMLPAAQPTGTPILREYDFEHFVVGDRNRFAWATAMAISKSPGQTTHNPLFLWGDVGMGKTHILHAIANHVLAHSPHFFIFYTSAEDFTSELIDAIQNNTVMKFRQRFRSVDVLLLDDVHFLAGKERAQEEFFHIFNTLFQAKKQIVVTSDRPPKDIAQLEKRLKSRFGAGVIVDIQPPDVETRVAILRRVVAERGSEPVADETLTVLAEGITSNVRQLKAALNQLFLLHEMAGEPLAPGVARKVLDQVVL